MDLPHQQRLRDVLDLEIGDGTAQIMKMIIARDKLAAAKTLSDQIGPRMRTLDSRGTAASNRMRESDCIAMQIKKLGGRENAILSQRLHAG